MSPRMTTLLSFDALAGSSGALVPETLPFLSSTRELSATVVASVWWAGLWIADFVMEVYGTLLGGSNSPVSMRIVNRWISALSITPSLRIPALMAAWMFGTVFSL